ncbi:MAG: dATP/dGTP diphosphohydrolase domain-containing protein [Candidatus Dormibacteria bacterium]
MNKTTTTNEGHKTDSGKVRMDLLDAPAITELARVMTHGAKKYGDYNYKKGIDYSRMYGAILRHLFSFWAGEDHDAETNLPHLAHAMAGCMMLLWYQNEKTEYDDRPEYFTLLA